MPERRAAKRKPIIHLGDAGKGAIECGAREQKQYHGYQRNWVWVLEMVTCKRCIAIRRRTDAER